jgi:hypothetical protein
MIAIRTYHRSRCRKALILCFTELGEEPNEGVFLIIVKKGFFAKSGIGRRRIEIIRVSFHKILCGTIALFSRKRSDILNALEYQSGSNF